MPEPLRTILLLAERPGVHDDGRSLVAFLDRLEAQGLSARVLCIEAEGDAEDDPRLVVCPGLDHAWRRPLAVRGLRLGDRLARPDLLHVLQASMSEAGLAIAEQWGTPYVLTVDEFLRPESRLRLSRRWCRKIVATSRELAVELRDEIGIPAALVAEIHPGIDAPASLDEMEGEREGLSPARVAGSSGRGVPVIGAAGALVASSGFGTFLTAAKRVFETGVDAEFVIAGQGEDEVDLRRKADRLKIAERVTFTSIPVLGARFWTVLDVYCQPSPSPSVGRALATAMAFGVPSVATDIEGLRTLVETGATGVRVPPNDSAALAAAILSLLADPSRAAALGEAGRALILRDYVPEVEARRLAELYAETLAAGAPTLATTASEGSDPDPEGPDASRSRFS